MIRFLLNLYRQRKKEALSQQQQAFQQQRKDLFFQNGQIPWSDWYAEHKTEQIKLAISDKSLLEDIALKKGLSPSYGYRLDERVVEYPWIFSQLSSKATTMLDAGSTFNFEYLLNEPIIANKYLFIHTYHPENPNFNQKRISYVYGDLRELPYKDNFFEEVVCQSTIEHIDMDNSMYGYDIAHVKEEKKSYEYVKVVKELLRVLKSQGTLLITFPYGKFENHGFFQQFDKEMLDKFANEFEGKGNYEFTFVRYTSEGWEFAKQADCEQAESYNPHTGRGKGTDGAAHSRAICCIKFIKK